MEIIFHVNLAAETSCFQPSAQVVVAALVGGCWVRGGDGLGGVGGWVGLGQLLWMLNECGCTSRHATGQKKTEGVNVRGDAADVDEQVRGRCDWVLEGEAAAQKVEGDPSGPGEGVIET